MFITTILSRLSKQKRSNCLSSFHVCLVILCCCSSLTSFLHHLLLFYWQLANGESGTSRVPSSIVVSLLSQSILPGPTLWWRHNSWKDQGGSHRMRKAPWSGFEAALLCPRCDLKIHNQQLGASARVPGTKLHNLDTKPVTLWELWNKTWQMKPELLNIRALQISSMNGKPFHFQTCSAQSLKALSGFFLYY